MPFSEQGFKAYPLRSPGNVRTWKFSSTGGNGNTTGQLVTQPQSILFECFGTFAAWTVTVQFSIDNSSYAPLATASLVFTSSGVLLVSPQDVKTGYYRLALTGSSGNPDLVCNMISIGSLDAL